MSGQRASIGRLLITILDCVSVSSEKGMSKRLCMPSTSLHRSVFLTFLFEHAAELPTHHCLVDRTCAARRPASTPLAAHSDDGQIDLAVGRRGIAGPPRVALDATAWQPSQTRPSSDAPLLIPPHPDPAPCRASARDATHAPHPTRAGRTTV